MTKRRTLLLPAAAVVVAAATAGCGSSGGSAKPAGSTGAPVGTVTSAASASAGDGGGPAPGTAESNPAGDIPDNQVYIDFRPANGGFTVKVPEGWARTGSGAVTVFTDKLNRITIAPVTASIAPTPGSVSSTVVPALRKSVPGFASPKVTTVSRKGGQVVLLTYQGDSAPDPVTGKVVRDAFERYAFHRGGHEVDLTLSGPVGADNVDPWRLVSDSFTWQGR
ncbi:hypothetical protein [Streptomyces sp. NPDC020917]|uniref:hypothetical protein n=1 Tax=Streptomyces sp. NPDC020917 TaxID=3365102 RepID=UPI0037A2EC8A